MINAARAGKALKPLPGLRSYATPAKRIGLFSCRSSQQALTAPLGDTKVAMSAFEPDSFINYQVGSVSDKAENGFRRHTAAY
jgi:hypothetical protein